MRELNSRQRIRACAALRPGPLTDAASATKAALRSLARRWQDQEEMMCCLKRYIAREIYPRLPSPASLAGRQRCEDRLDAAICGSACSGCGHVGRLGAWPARR
jgi:hypothetical protein